MALTWRGAWERGTLRWNKLDDGVGFGGDTHSLKRKSKKVK